MNLKLNIRNIEVHKTVLDYSQINFFMNPLGK